MLPFVTALLLTAPGPGDECTWRLRLLDARGRPHACCPATLILAPPRPRFEEAPRRFRGLFSIRPSHLSFRVDRGRTDRSGRVTFRFRLRNRRRPRQGMVLWLRVSAPGRHHFTHLELPSLTRFPARRQEVRTRPLASLALKLEPPLPGSYLLCHPAGVTLRPRVGGPGRVLAFPALPRGRYTLHYSPVARRVDLARWLFHCRSTSLPLAVEEKEGEGTLATAPLTPCRLLLRLRTWRGAARGFRATIMTTGPGDPTRLVLGRTDRWGRLPPCPLLPATYRVEWHNTRYGLDLPGHQEVRIRPGRNHAVDAHLATGGVRVELVDPAGRPAEGALPPGLQLFLFPPGARRFHRLAGRRLAWDAGGRLLLRGLPPGTVVAAGRGGLPRPFHDRWLHLATIRKGDLFTTRLVLPAGQ